LALEDIGCARCCFGGSFVIVIGTEVAVESVAGNQSRDLGRLPDKEGALSLADEVVGAFTFGLDAGTGTVGVVAA
jgi:hypothetical protein